MTLAVAWNKTSMSYNVNNNFGPNVVCYTRKTVQGVSEINARGGAIGWGTALHPGRLRVRFPTVSLQFFIDFILPAAL